MRSAADLSALPLVSAAPKPSAWAVSSMFCSAQPADSSRSVRSIAGSPPSVRATASSNQGARKALARASSCCTAVACGSRSSSASAKAWPSAARAAAGTTTKRQGISCP